MVIGDSTIIFFDDFMNFDNTSSGISGFSFGLTFSSGDSFVNSFTFTGSFISTTFST